MRFTAGTVYVPPNGAGIVQLGAGCNGQAGHAGIDLVVTVEGDGRTRGSGDDALRIMNARPGPTNLDVEAHLDCGPRQGAAHQDGIQILGGTNVTFYNSTIGNYDAGLSTCQGAGGSNFYSMESNNIRFVGGKFVACNHALLAGTGSGRVENASFRSGRTDGSDPVCSRYAASPPCLWQDADIQRGPGVVCQQWGRGGGWQNASPAALRLAHVARVDADGNNRLNPADIRFILSRF